MKKKYRKREFLEAANKLRMDNKEYGIILLAFETKHYNKNNRSKKEIYDFVQTEKSLEALWSYINSEE